MAKIAVYCMKNQDFRNLVNHRKSVIHWHSPSSRTYKSETTNELLGKYDGANGIKTGWTNAAKGCVAASAKRGDVELIAIVMKSKDHATRFADAKKLLDYGFSVGGKGKVPAEQPVKADTKRVPNVKKPGTSFSSTVSNKPVSVSVTESKQVVTKQPVATQPAVVSSSMTKQSEHVSVSNHSTSTPAVSAKAPAASSTPTANNTGIRMPVVRRPGA
jgi:D-alanyl-D-alanine carboxypeptidase (penicillin-binding protein 5/6)